MELNIDKNKELYIKLCRNYIKRPGLDKVLALLDRTDFYTAPASKTHHSNVKGGLCYHSLSVFFGLLDLLDLESYKIKYEISAEVDLVKDGFRPNGFDVRVEEATKKVFGENVSLESLAITGLFHDFHKINYYEEYDKPIMKGYDNSGKKIWEHEKHYKVKDDALVMGLDGSNSNYIISTMMGLTYDERLAIENHMGYISGMGLLPSASKAWSKSKLAIYLHLADMMAAYVYENTVEVKDV